MRILFITVRADYGGGPEHVYQLVKQIQGNHHYIQCFIACPQDKPYYKRYSELLGESNILEIPHRKFSIQSLLQLKDFCHVNQIELIHSHGKGAGVYGRFLSLITRIPSVHTPHGIHIDQYNKVKKIFYLTYEKLFSLFVKKVIFVSESEKYKANQYSIWPKYKQTVILNGVNKISFDKEKKLLLRDILNISRESFVVLSISRFDYQKNMLEAFKIAQLLPEFIFVWLGDGSDRSEIEKIAKQNNIDNIRFEGFKDNVSEYLIASDIILSTSRWEGLSLGLLEAMSAGIPIVASRVTGNSDTVEHGINGFLYQLGDIDEACSYLKKIKNKILYNEISQHSTERYEQNYSVEVMAEKTVNLYRQVLKV